MHSKSLPFFLLVVRDFSLFFFPSKNQMTLNQYLREGVSHWTYM